MGSCTSTSAKVACDTESYWLEFADDAGDSYWYNYLTGNCSRVPQYCDWYFVEEWGVWYKESTQEFRQSPPASRDLAAHQTSYSAQQIADAPIARAVGQVPVAELSDYTV